MTIEIDVEIIQSSTVKVAMLPLATILRNWQ